MQSPSYDRGRSGELRPDVPAGLEPHEPARMPGDVHKVYEHPEKAGHPDGVPHDIVLRTAFGAVLVTLVGAFAYLAFGIIVAVIVAAVTLWLVWRGVPRKARIERTHEAAVEAVTPHPPARVTDEPRGDENA